MPAGAPPAFQCGAQTFTLDDILEGARCLGEFEPFRAAWRQCRAAAQAAEAAGLSVDPAQLEASVEAFRYARDLISGEECERWLEARGLAFEHLVAERTRRLLAELAETGVPGEPECAGDGETAADADDENNDDDGLRADALLSDEFNRWARALARRVAVSIESGQDVDSGPALADQWPRLEAALAAATGLVITPERRQRALVIERLALTRVRFERAEFDSEAAVREAILCASEDGAPLREVAAANGFPCAMGECFLGEVTAAWADLLTSARVGEVASPGSSDGTFVVLSVLDRRAPTLDDPEVVKRIDASLVEQRLRELEARHIRWLINVETAP